MATKKALLIGLNYPGTKKPLKCSVRNAKKVKKYLQKYFRFESQNITLLTDDDDSGRSDQSIIQVTAYDIMKQLSMLIEDAKDQDILFYYFCGHGGSYKAKHANNSGYVEYMVGSGKTRFKDTTFRNFVETVRCSFTAVVDACRSGAIIEGANEIIGESTRNPSIYIKKAPKDKRFQFGMPTGRGLGILVTSCQNHQNSKQKYYKRGKEYGTYFTRCFLDVIKETQGNVSNLELVQLTGQKMANLLVKYREEDRHNPGLYCDNSQKDLLFLSHEVKVVENKDVDDDDEV